MTAHVCVGTTENTATSCWQVEPFLLVHSMDCVVFHGPVDMVVIGSLGRQSLTTLYPEIVAARVRRVGEITAAAIISTPIM